MQTVTQTRKPTQRKKADRACRLAQTDGGPALVIRQTHPTQGVSVDCYFLQSIASEIGGKGVELTKHDGTRYTVRLDGKASTCECKGFCRWSHCKHVESLLALQVA